MAIPPFQHNTQVRGDYRDICFLASRHKIPTTAGYAGRISSSAAKSAEDSLLAVIGRGQVDPSNLFIVERSRFPDIFLGLGQHWQATILDGYHVCWHKSLGVDIPSPFSAAEKISLADFLTKCQDRSLLMAVKDESTAGLTGADKEALSSVGVNITSLKYRGSLVAIVHKGHCVWQESAPDEAIQKDVAKGQILDDFTSPALIQLISAGYLVGNRAVIAVNGENLSFNHRGLNIVVPGNDRQPTLVGYFDTHKGGEGVVVTCSPPVASAASK